NAGAETSLESVLESLLAELADDKNKKINLIKRCGLDDFLWEQLRIHFGYISETPGVKDFVIDLFESCYAISLKEKTRLSQNALVFLNRWKDNVHHQNAFRALSEYCANILNIESKLQKQDIHSLAEVDYFELIDKKILSCLVHQVAERTISSGDCSNLIWRRRSTHWYKDFKHIYQAIDKGSQFLAALDKSDLRMQSLPDGIHKYIKNWYQLDQFYRKFIYHLRASNQTTLLQPLTELVENLYTNNYLLKVNNNWQQFIDTSQVWAAAPIVRQDQFFNHWVGELQNNHVKVAVVISDALRYEIAQELTKLIEEERRFTAQIEPMLGMLPSYTQLGMAALLPQGGVSLDRDGVAHVQGQSTQGTKNRAGILDSAIEGGATALRSSDLLSMSRDESRTMVKNHQVIYIYHNQIDATGDKLGTEERVFDAVEESLEELVDIFKKLDNANLSNILVTADHGFIYQHQTLDESEFANTDVQGQEIFRHNRRYVLGKGLVPDSSVKLYQAADLGLIGDFEVAIPKSINRLRSKGSGSRFVHGGASLQEVIIPVIKINKARTGEIPIVEVDIISSSSSIITTGQLSVALYQEEPVSAKLQSRKLRVGIYTQNDELISNVHDLNFDFTSENHREREVRVRFILSTKANKMNKQDVYLKLKEREPGTSRYTEYKSRAYKLRRSFTSDFDF
ncbi:MAG: BREX-1 system phosphatase PglZ type A, partial [Chloroflexota bacterium]